MLVKATYVPSFLKEEIEGREQKRLEESLGLLESISKIVFSYVNNHDRTHYISTYCDIDDKAIYIIRKYTDDSGTITNIIHTNAINSWNEHCASQHKDLTHVEFELTSVYSKKVASLISNELDTFKKRTLPSGALFGKQPSLKFIVYKSTTPLDQLWDGILAPAIAHLQNQTVPKKRVNIHSILLEAEKERTNADLLDSTILSDPEQGHWDLYWSDAVKAEAWYDKIILAEKLCARNPKRDIQYGVPVSIDFGTTSTVVALREHGIDRLLRVGMRDWHTLNSKDYENPTVLEVLDFASFMQAWQALPYKPFTKWEHMKCSHVAKEEMSNNATCTTMQSCLVGLKTWAHTGIKNILHRQDQQNKDFTIQALSLNHRSGEDACDTHPSIADFATRAFDPIEVYAWFLGMAINNQLQGGGRIYPEYHLSFPVKFPKETRERVLHSFRRGLERSLPPSLGLNEKWQHESPLQVQEGANEPVAYAASALEALKLEPTEDGLAFGVFDFGGGTTDFAVGLYRTSTAKEELEDGWEQVLELLDSSGDAYLGGEHLLHHMACIVIKDNLEKFLQTGKGIPFTMPADAEHFAGAEVLADTSLVAQTNTNKLCEALRPLWEEQALDAEVTATGQMEITLFDRHNEEIPLLALSIDKEKLENYLYERILRGVEDFFRTFRQAFKMHEKRTETFHILLAGNSCRSAHVQKAFETLSQHICEDAYVPNDIIFIHNPLHQDDKETLFSLKTGVALGLLRTAPGESTGIVQQKVMHDGETAFRFSVGTFKRNILMPVLSRHSEYNEWENIGIVRKDLTLILGYSSLALALEHELPRRQCHEKRLTFEAGHQGKDLFIRALSPTSFEIGIQTDDNIVSITSIHLEG